MSPDSTEKRDIRVELKSDLSPKITEISEAEELQESNLPWINRRDKAAFPWQGIIGLSGSCVTILCSWALLFNINDTQQWQDVWPRLAKILTPAAILSAIISLNGIFLHMAFVRGTAIAWWLRANSSKATVGKLHEAWLQSSDLLEAVRSGRRFSYLALATTFVAIVPINGILLQGALQIRQTLVAVPSSGVKLPFSADFPSNFTGYLNEDGDLNGITTRFSSYVYRYFSRQNRAQIVITTNVTSIADQNPAYIYALDSFSTGCEGTCAFKALGVGLHMDCSNPITQRPYNFSVNDSSAVWADLPVVKEGLPIYSVSFDWNVSRPNEIQFNLLSKTDYACSGFYKELTCSLTATTTEYQALLQNNQTIAVGQSATLLSMPKDSEYDNVPMISPIPANNERESLETKFGFLAQIFNDVYGNNITLQYSNNSGGGQYALSQTGIYANAPWIVFGPDGDADATPEFTLDIAARGSDGCQTYIQDTEDPLENDRDIILGNINRLMFYLSYRDGNYNADDETALQTFSPATDTIWQNRYHVVWYHWGASVAVTLLIVFCITPTFWGFWNLARIPDMSPLETARAFHAPVLADQNPRLMTQTILGGIQDRSIHIRSTTPP